MAAGYFIRFDIYTLVRILLFQFSKREIIAEIGGNDLYKIVWQLIYSKSISV